MKTGRLGWIAFACVAVSILPAVAWAGNGESAAADLATSRLRVLEPVGIFETKPPAVQEVVVGELVQVQLSYPIIPRYPKHAQVKVADRALTALAIAGSDGRVAVLYPGKPQTGLIGVGHFSVFLRANTAGPTSAEVTVTLSDDSKTKVPLKFLIREPKKTDGAQRVKKILKIDYAIEKGLPPTLRVTATGEVPTLGWTEPKLVRRVYVQPPPDGIWEYEFHAVPPSGQVPQVVSPIQATDRWENFDQASVKGVRVFGEGDGVKEIRFDKDRKESSRTPHAARAARAPRDAQHVYIYPFPLAAKDQLVDGPDGKPFELAGETILAWVDLQPNAKFAHPTLYVLISGNEARVLPGQWWPVLNGKRILSGASPSYTIQMPFVLPTGEPRKTVRLAVYPLTLKPGDKLTDGVQGDPLPIAEPTALLWVDLQPGARFVHPTLHVLISRNQTRALKGQWFPVLNGKPILYGQPLNYTVTSPFVIQDEPK